MAITLDPKFDIAYLNRGKARVKLGESNAAIDDLTKSIELGASNIPDAYESRGEAYSNPGKKDLAAKDKAMFVKLSHK
jgi:tetratricopeptide (TPR) repeat protein